MPSTTAPIRHPTTKLASATILLLACFALLGLATPATGAPTHGGPGEIAVVAAEPTDGGAAVHLEVAITYIGDGEAAERATVTVSGTTPDGQSTGPVDVTTTEVVGTYVADVPVPGPGDWTFSVVSTFPPATLDVPVTVAAATTDTSTAETTTTTDTAVTPTDATTTSSDTTAADTAASATADGDLAASSDDSDDDDGGLGAGPAIALVVGVLAAVGGAVYALRRRGA